jgi:serine phosphatase RsbU (regulator of sigma subunit)
MDHRIELSPGDVVVGYTDGVAEQYRAFDANHVNNLVMDVLVQQGDDPKDIANAIMQGSKRQHLDGFDDDATVFVVRIK